MTAISVSISHFGDGIKCFLPSKYAARYLGTEVGNVASLLDKGIQTAVAW